MISTKTLARGRAISKVEQMSSMTGSFRELQRDGLGTGLHPGRSRTPWAQGILTPVLTSALNSLQEVQSWTKRDAAHPGVQVITGDGALGYQPAAPYDRIIVTAEATGINRGEHGSWQ
jgi:hypothetical protein